MIEFATPVILARVHCSQHRAPTSWRNVRVPAKIRVYKNKSIKISISVRLVSVSGGNCRVVEAWHACVWGGIVDLFLCNKSSRTPVRRRSEKYAIQTISIFQGRRNSAEPTFRWTSGDIFREKQLESLHLWVWNGLPQCARLSGISPRLDRWKERALFEDWTKCFIWELGCSLNKLSAARWAYFCKQVDPYVFLWRTFFQNWLVYRLVGPAVRSQMMDTVRGNIASSRVSIDSRKTIKNGNMAISSWLSDVDEIREFWNIVNERTHIIYLSIFT